MSLFEPPPPLAARMRPRDFDDLVGQEHVVGPGSTLRALVERDELRSAILWGPPGTGKTTIAHIVADRTKSPVSRLSAVSSGVADVRKVIASAKATGRTVLFIDEIHRFNKSQQDALLNAVEDGSIVLIGATTENPFFEVNSPLMSRSLLFRLEPLEPQHVRTILHRALERELPGVTADDDALEWIATKAGGDARLALGALEAASVRGEGHVKLDDAVAAMERRVVRWDKAGDRHYDVISAFIKSMRGSDPDAALYWLYEMFEAGEDPKFIARRMIILASEDIGMADPQALVVAVAAAHALEHVGLPEAEYALSHACVYLSKAPKSNAIARAMQAARADVRERSQDVPLHLRTASHPGLRKLGHGQGYKYSHDDPSPQEFRPAEIQGHVYYEERNDES